MYHFFAESSQLFDDGKKIVISGDDFNHMVNVLRMKTGEEFSVSIKEDPGLRESARESSGAVLREGSRENSGADFRESNKETSTSKPVDLQQQKEYRFGIESISESELIGELRFVKEAGTELPSRIYLFQGLPKSDKMELIIQKSVELGVFEVIPVAMKRCVMKLDDKKASSRIKRWNAISEAAAKQSKRGIIPEVKMPMSFKEAVKYASKLDVKLLPYELADGMDLTRRLISEIEPGQSVGIFIGPEGGFAEEEVTFARDEGFTPVTMGRRILRTETAGFTMLSWLMYTLER